MDLSLSWSSPSCNSSLTTSYFLRVLAGDVYLDEQLLSPEAGSSVIVPCGLFDIIHPIYCFQLVSVDRWRRSWIWHQVCVPTEPGNTAAQRLLFNEGNKPRPFRCPVLPFFIWHSSNEPEESIKSRDENNCPPPRLSGVAARCNCRPQLADKHSSTGRGSFSLFRDRIRPSLMQ